MEKFLTKAAYQKKVDKLNEIYWTKSSEKRWGYMSSVITELKKIDPDSMLELGAFKINLSSISDNMDLDTANIDPDNKNNMIYIQDATKVPWDIENKKYDCVVALQVFEHLEGKQSQVFSEIQRISRSAILSFPYMWNCPGNCHHEINEEIISRWTNNVKPEKVIMDKSINNVRRIAYVFKF